MNQTFDDRFSRVAQELKRLYMSLYHDEHAYESHDWRADAHPAGKPRL